MAITGKKISELDEASVNAFKDILGIGEKIIDVTYDELLALMDSSGDGLVPGQFYRITDFATVHYMVDNVTATEDINTGSTEPLIVLAISESALDSRAYSELYSYDVIHYDWNPANWLTDVSFGGNDGTLVTGFKGVIYFRHDTLHDNYMGYDFRNVKFRRWNNGSEVGPVWASEYQSYKSDGVGVTDPEDYIDVLTFNCPGGEEQYNNQVRSIHIEPFKDQKDISYYTNSILCNNVFYLEADYGWFQAIDTTIASFSCFNTFNGFMESNVIGPYFSNNIIGFNFFNNIIGGAFYENIIESSFCYNTIGNRFSSNTIGNDFASNVIGNDFASNVIGDDCKSFFIGNLCNNITIADGSVNISIGNGSSYIELGDSSGGVNNIDIGQGCGGEGQGIVIGGLSYTIKIEDACHTLQLGEGVNDVRLEAECFDIILEAGVSGVICESYCHNITINGNAGGVYFNTNCSDIVIASGSWANIFGVQCSKLILPENSINNIFVNYVRLPEGATKDFTDSLVNQITDGSQVTHRMCGTKIVGTYLEEQSGGSFVEVHAENIIGVCESYWTKLTFDDIANVPVADASDVSAWNTWFDLPTNGTPFTSVSVDGNVVTLEGGSGIKFKDYLFGDDACGEHILEIEDSGCVTELGEGVFSDWGSGSGCYNLTKAIFPYVTTVGEWCFADCEALVDIDLSSLTAESFDSVTSLFNWCPSLVDVSKCVPEGITSIPEGTFSGNAIESFVIPDSVTSLGYNAFGSCTSLTTVTIGNSVITIGDYAFTGCSVLTTVTIGNSVITIGEDAFSHCSVLTTVTIGNGVTSIGKNVFYNCTGLINVTIPASVTTIGDYAFYNCTSLKSVDADGLTSLGVNAFGSCISLTTVTIGNGVITIGENAFAHCSALTTVTLSDSLINIRSAAFYNCSALPSITIPASVTTIGDYAFTCCSSLQTVNMYPITAPIINYAFTNYNAATLHIQAGATGYDVAPWTDTMEFASIVQDL